MGITLDTIDLPADLIWSDEFDWTPVKQNKSYTLTGALVVESGVMLAGRPITLAGGDNHGWASRAVVKSLYALAGTDAVMTLTLNDASVHSVRFDFDGQPIAARQIVDYNNPGDDDHYSLTLKFIEV